MKITKLMLGMAFTAAMLGNIVFAQTNTQITSIRNEVAAINKSLQRYKTTNKDVEGVSLEGTQATYYTSGRGLHKITAKMYGETYRSTAELYYQGEQLIFAYQRIFHYKAQIGIPGGTRVVKVEERRFYFSGEKLIRYLNGKSVVGSGDFFAEHWDQIKEIADKLKESYIQSL